MVLLRDLSPDLRHDSPSGAPYLRNKFLAVGYFCQLYFIFLFQTLLIYDYRRHFFCWPQRYHDGPIQILNRNFLGGWVAGNR